MRSKTFGRALGIGVRFAGKALLDGKPSPPPGSAAALAATAAAERSRVHGLAAAAERGRAVGTHAGKSTRNVRRGAKNFTRAVWNPFALATSVLWLEITGLFFALFMLFFAQHLYELRGAWHAGPQHQRFLLYAALTVLFLYFSASSFLRARRKEKARS